MTKRIRSWQQRSGGYPDGIQLMIWTLTMLLSQQWVRPTSKVQPLGRKCPRSLDFQVIRKEHKPINGFFIYPITKMGTRTPKFVYWHSRLVLYQCRTSRINYALFLHTYLLGSLYFGLIFGFKCQSFSSVCIVWNSISLVYMPGLYCTSRQRTGLEM